MNMRDRILKYILVTVIIVIAIIVLSGLGVSDFPYWMFLSGTLTGMLINEIK